LKSHTFPSSFPPNVLDHLRLSTQKVILQPNLYNPTTEIALKSICLKMGNMSYNKVGNGMIRRCRGSRGFRLNPKRFSVQRLRERFIYLFKLINRWRSSYGQALKSLKKGLGRRKHSIKRNSSSSSSSSTSGSSSRSLVPKVPNMARADHSRLRSFGRTNSFYAEAIADCLEFIKRSSLSVDQNPAIQR
jgi:hypothetical protein